MFYILNNRVTVLAFSSLFNQLYIFQMYTWHMFKFYTLGDSFIYYPMDIEKCWVGRQNMGWRSEVKACKQQTNNTSSFHRHLIFFVKSTPFIIFISPRQIFYKNFSFRAPCLKKGFPVANFINGFSLRQLFP